jgi:hypothetical protein
MKVYVLYVLSDYSHAIHMSVEKYLCEQEMAECIKRGVRRPMWIEEYDFSESKEFELDCD